MDVKNKKNHKLKQALHYIKLHCLTNLVSVQIQNTPYKKNFNIIIREEPSPLYLQPKNFTFHNLCNPESVLLQIT